MDRTNSIIFVSHWLAESVHGPVVMNIFIFTARVARIYRFCLVCVCVSVRLSVWAWVSGRGLYTYTPLTHTPPLLRQRAVRSSLELILVMNSDEMCCDDSYNLVVVISWKFRPPVVWLMTLTPASVRLGSDQIRFSSMVASFVAQTKLLTSQTVIISTVSSVSQLSDFCRRSFSRSWCRRLWVKMWCRWKNSSSATQ